MRRSPALPESPPPSRPHLPRTGRPGGPAGGQAGPPPGRVEAIGDIFTVGTAGTLTSAFAVGMVIGAPLVAALARNWPRRSSLLGFILTFAAAHVVGAITTSFLVLFTTRVVAALANAGFLAAALAAATLVAPDKKGRA